MATRDPNLAAAIIVGLYACLFLAVLAVVLMVPTEIRMPRAAGFAIAVAAFVGIPILSRMAERSRIRHAVQDMGGTVEWMRRLPFWRQDWFYGLREAKYRVIFVDISGERIRARCRSGFLRGVTWSEFEPMPATLVPVSVSL